MTSLLLGNRHYRGRLGSAIFVRGRVPPRTYADQLQQARLLHSLCMIALLRLMQKWPEMIETVPRLAATLPTLPTALAETAIPAVTGSSFNTGNLQTDLNSAAAANGALVHEVIATAGSTYTGPFTIPARSGTGAIIVRTSNVGGLPASGVRATTAQAAAMPTIRCESGATPGPAIQTAGSSTRYWFQGIDFDVGSLPTGEVFSLVDTGGPGSGGSGNDQIIFDRCLFRNTNDELIRHALIIGATNFGVLNSSFYNINEAGAGTENHCILVGETTGPTLIQNNYLEGQFAILIGGFSWTGTQQDITIRRNHYFRLSAWVAAGNNKHFVEGKTGIRVLVEQNICDTNDTLNISDIRIYFTEFDGTGSDIADWTVRYNQFVNNAFDNPAVDLAGDFNGNRPTTARRIHIHNNLAYNYLRAFQLQHEIQDVTIEHNTMDCVSRNLVSNDELNSPSRFEHRNNIYVNANQYDYYHIDTAQAGTAGMAAFWTGGSTGATNNCFVDRPNMTGMPTGDFDPSLASVAFVNQAGGDYSLAAGSVCKAGQVNDADDGTDNGCDIATLNTKLAGVLTGAAESASAARPTASLRPTVSGRPAVLERPQAPSRPADGYN